MIENLRALESWVVASGAEEDRAEELEAVAAALGAVSDRVAAARVLRKSAELVAEAEAEAADKGGGASSSSSSSSSSSRGVCWSPKSGRLRRRLPRPCRPPRPPPPPPARPTS